MAQPDPNANPMHTGNSDPMLPPVRPYDPLESLLRRGEFLDIDLLDPDFPADGPAPFSVGSDASGARTGAGDTVGISTGALSSSGRRGESDPTVRHVPNVGGAPTAMDCGKVADNIALGQSARYRVRKELGAGGMATVYDAVDLDLRRHVAIKVLHDEHLKKAQSGNDSEDRSALQRFIEEAQITGQLEHPNIVPVHEIGRDEAGRIYFTMKRVEGGSLADIIDRMRQGDQPTLERYGAFELCEIFVRVCEAIAFAHSRRVIHRDLKPDNIMVGRFGEVQVMDWGLAKVKGTAARPGAASRATETFTGTVSTGTGAAQQTIEGTISGTPAYMPPEQARGEVNRIDERSDVFMLGGILYELITLVPPYHAESSLSALLRAQKHDLAEPRRAVEDLAATRRLPDGTPVSADGIARARQFPPELAAIAMKALREKPEDRYQTPQELAREVERYLKREPVAVFDYPFHLRAAKWVNQHRIKASVLAGMLIMGMLTAVIVAWMLKLQAEDESEQRQVLYSLEVAARTAASAEQARLQLEAERFSRRARANEKLNLGTDLLKRLADMRDKDLAHQARLEVERLFTDAISADQVYTNAWQARAEVRLDLGHFDRALGDIDRGVEAALEGGLKPSPASLMSGGMALLTKGILRLENDTIWNDKFRGYMRQVREVAAPESDYWQLADILERAMDNLTGQRQPEELTASMQQLGSRMEKLVHPNQRLWEVHLFAAWFASSGWMGGDGDHAARHTAAMEQVDRALALRRNLPVAIMFRTQLLYQDELQRARASRDPAFQGRGGSFRMIAAVSRASLPGILAVLDEYVSEFPHDPFGHYMRGSMPVRMGLPVSDGQRAQCHADLKRASDLFDNPAPAFTAIALLLEGEGRHGEAADATAAKFTACAEAGDFVTGNWSPGTSGFTPTILHVRCLIQAGRHEEAVAALQTVRACSQGQAAMYSEHYAEALRAIRRFGDRAAAEEFMGLVRPEPMMVRDHVATASTMLFLGMTEEAGAQIGAARTLAAQKGTTVENELAELSRSHAAQAELLSTVQAPSAGPGRQDLTLSQWRAFVRMFPGDPPAEEMEERWTAVLREPESATLLELRQATTYWARRLSSGDAIPPEITSEREQLVVRGYAELQRVNPRSARAVLDGSPELKALLERQKTVEQSGG